MKSRAARPKGRLFDQHHVEATAFLHEIIAAADAIRDARSFDGEPAVHFGARGRLLRAVERCGCAPTFSEIARSLGILRQAARESSGSFVSDLNDMSSKCAARPAG